MARREPDSRTTGVMVKGFLIMCHDGELRGTVASWKLPVPMPFKTREAADKYKYLGKIVPATIKVTVDEW
jgi:hypothetical protein